jgi:hypothetical protein
MHHWFLHNCWIQLNFCTENTAHLSLIYPLRRKKQMQHEVLGLVLDQYIILQYCMLPSIYFLSIPFLLADFRVTTLLHETIKHYPSGRCVIWHWVAESGRVPTWVIYLKVVRRGFQNWRSREVSCFQTYNWRVFLNSLLAALTSPGYTIYRLLYYLTLVHLLFSTLWFNKYSFFSVCFV